ncbi:hypothetical protein Bca52824_084640 [Brassica carinata]|uniref:Ammonium transporter AmtB-like domain-containing protein n=1 Tax=Brassica carinata TaxID=52824 RepID=A0A8X7TUS3_BRACI|nr:hypothetical protein Bca52824_084640 [Brassica carinata]
MYNDYTIIHPAIARRHVDDTLAVFFYTHAVAGVLGGLLTGLFAHPDLCVLSQTPTELSTAATAANMSTTLILLAIKMFIPLRMAEEELGIGDDAAHGEEACALWGDGEKFDATRHETQMQQFERDQEAAHPSYVYGARGVTIVL